MDVSELRVKKKRSQMFFVAPFNYELQNVIYLGLCFMVLFMADYPVTNMQKILISSIQDEKPSFKIEGYTSLGVTYTIFGISLWFGPSMVAVLGMRLGMSLSALCYTLYILAFNVEEAWAIYAVTVIGGVAGGIIWTAEGSYVVANSTSETISRNVSIFWAFLQLSSLLGNSYALYKFEGKSRIDGPTRRNVIYVLGAVAAFSAIMFLFLRPARKAQIKSNVTVQNKNGPLKEFKRTWTIFTSKNICILSIIFMYTGLQHAFIYAVYSSCIGFTEAFGNQSKQLVALSGIFISIGEVCGGGFLIVFSKILNRFSYKRLGVLVFGIIIEIGAFILVYINLPNSSVFRETNEVSLIEPSAVIAMVCSFCFGVGDSFLNTQNFSIIGVLYPEDSLQSSALYKCIKSIFVAVGLYSSVHVGLHTQMMILAPVAVLGMVAFIIVDRNTVSILNADLQMATIDEQNKVTL